MKFLQFLFSFVISFSGIITTIAIPLSDDSKHECVSYASWLTASKLLKLNNDIDGNQVYSPLGLTAILALLAEASTENVYEEFVNILHYPPERQALRHYYKTLLADYQKRLSNIDSWQPSFQIWFYIYRNFSVHETFRKVAREYYYVDVKDVNREEYSWSNANTTINKHIASSNSKDVVGFETLKFFKIDNEVNDVLDRVVSATTSSSSLLTSYTDNYLEEFLEKETSKFDRYVNEDQYVAKPQIIEESKHQPVDKQQAQNACKSFHAKQENPHEKPVFLDVTTDASSVDRDDVNKTQQKPQLAETSLLTALENLPAAKSEQLTNATSKEEKLYAEESLKSQLSMARNLLGKRTLLQSGNVASALSASSIKTRELEPQTKALLFNGFYFRANWGKYVVEPYGQSDLFHMTAEDSIKVAVIHLKGEFGSSELAHLNAKLICLPYQNERYSLIIILPNELEGMHNLIDKLQVKDLTLAKSQISKKSMHVVLPKLQVEETSHSESMLKNLGLKKIFSEKTADLSQLSDEKGLTVEEIVQYVSIGFDDDVGNSTASLSTSADQSHSQAEQLLEVIEVNHPFLYFLIDYQHDYVLVSGKVFHPEVPEKLSETWLQSDD